MTTVTAGIKIPKVLATKINSCPGIKAILETMIIEEELHPRQGMTFTAIKQRVPSDEELRKAHQYLLKAGIIVRKKDPLCKEHIWIIKPELTWSIRNYLNQTGVYAA